MGTLFQDVRYAVRMLLKNPAFSVIAVLSLALGIGANTTIFTVVNAILLHSLPVKSVSRLVQVDTIDAKTRVTQANAEKQGMSYGNFKDYAKENQVFSGLACIAIPPITWSNGAEPKQIQGQLVSANYFDILGINPAVGRFFLPDEDTKLGGNNVVVVSHAFWMNKLGSNPNALGKTLNLNAVPYTLIGVAPRGFRSTFTFASAEQVWIPVSMYPAVLSGFFKQNFDTRRFLGTTVIGRLKPGISVSQAEASLKIMARHLESEFPTDNAGRSVVLTPLADAAVGANNHAQIALAGGLMMGVVGLVLLIACVNLTNLLLAQAARREKEIGLRTALGASGGRMLRQLLTESLVLALLGAAAGLVIAVVGRSALWSLRPPFIEDSGIDLSLDSHVLLFTLGVALFTALLIGVAPAIRAAKPDVAEVLKAGGRGGTVGWARNPLRSLLVVAEMGLALVALVCAGLFIRSMQNAQATPLGFESEKLFAMAFDLGALHYNEGRGQQFFRAAVERAKASPGVESATIASNPLLAGTFLRTVFPEGQNETSGYRGTLTALNDIGTRYFETLRIPLIRGRVFTDADRQDMAPVAIVNQAMAKHFWPNQDAVGKRFHFFGDQFLREVVGVVGNSVVNQIGEEPQPLVYLPITQDYAPAATVQVRTSGRPEAVIGTVRRQIQSVDPNLALTNVQTIREAVAQGLWAPRMGAGLLTVFGVLALVLAAVGVYGVLSYSVNQQTREIGVRVALGARSSQVLWMVVGNGLGLAGIGLLVGLLIALGLTRALSSLLFGISPNDPLTFGGVSLVLTATALLACYIPARRATKVDPVIALRYE
ncbi:MAG: ABC transporter permease [Acidobacteriaceae bacterium]|nr:ABC transporter permease [Acidobacteriaceae bacterium]MBV9781942.1 ABC transporter permease [Acidobacteriaceae bacterium]